MTSYFVSNRRIGQQRFTQKSAGLAILLAFAVLLAGPTFGQTAPSGDAAKKQTTRKKAAGRLPAHFSAVVSPKQREAIYKLQAEYATQLEKLQAQLDALIADRDRAVDEVLDADQLAEVVKKREDAKKRRAARSSAKSETTTANDG